MNFIILVHVAFKIVFLKKKWITPSKPGQVVYFLTGSVGEHILT